MVAYLNGNVTSKDMKLFLSRAQAFERYAQRHPASEVIPRLECTRCHTVVYCCKGGEISATHRVNK
jgi:hypothetical protein